MKVQRLKIIVLRMLKEHKMQKELIIKNKIKKKNEEIY